MNSFMSGYLFWQKYYISYVIADYYFPTCKTICFALFSCVLHNLLSGIEYLNVKMVLSISCTRHTHFCFYQSTIEAIANFIPK